VRIPFSQGHKIPSWDDAQIGYVNQKACGPLLPNRYSTSKDLITHFKVLFAQDQK